MWLAATVVDSEECFKISKIQGKILWTQENDGGEIGSESTDVPMTVLKTMMVVAGSPTVKSQVWAVHVGTDLVEKK